MQVIKLVVEHGSLCFPFGGHDDQLNRLADKSVLLLARYAAGDCDTIPWPMRSDFATQPELMKRLQSALYDEREMNPFFPVDAVIALPDNTIVEF